MRGAILAILFFISCTMQGQGLIIDSWRFAAAVAVDLLANNKSIDFDGSAEYVSIPDADNLSFGDGSTDSPFSISVWANLDDYTSSWLIGKDDGGTGSEYYLIANTGDKIQFVIWDESTGGGYSEQTNSAYTSDQGKWVHWTGTYDGSGLSTGLKIYRNGVLVTSTTTTSGSYTAMENTPGILTIGTIQGSPGAALVDGKMDQVAIWDTVLSIDEIKEAMAIRDYNYHSRVDNLVSWWEFDNDTLGTDGITDLVGTNHGTMTNGEYADLNVHVTWPYSYQLNNTAAYDSLTPMQSAGVSDSVFGGFSWDFNSVTEHIEIPDDDLLSFTDMSINVWVSMDDMSNRQIIEKSGEYLLEFNASNILEAKFYDTDGDYIGRKYNTSLITRFKHQWINIIVTYDDSESASSDDAIDIWVNGIEVDDTDVNSGVYGGMVNKDSAIWIGSGGGNFLDGRISDLSLHDVVLTDIDGIYNNHEPGQITGAVAYYRAYNSTNTSNGILDQSGNGLHGTAYNMGDADFIYDYSRELVDSAGCFDYDGINEHDSIPDAANLSFGDGSNDSPFSISFWYKSNTNAQDAIITKRDGTDYEWAVYFASGYIQFHVRDDSASNATRGKQSTTQYQGGYLNLWDHWVCKYDGRGGTGADAGIFIYRNGVLIATSTISTGTYTAMEDLSSPVWIGRMDAGIYNLNGQLSHVSVIGKDLSLYEIQELYNHGSPVDITAVTFASDVISHWRLDQTDDPTGTITDIVGSNDGFHKNGEAGDLKTETFPSGRTGGL